MPKYTVRLGLVCAALLGVSLACTILAPAQPANPPPEDASLATQVDAAVQQGQATREAELMQRATQLARLENQVTPTALRSTLRPSSTPVPSPTVLTLNQPTPAGTPVVSKCDHYQMLRDVTIPDGTFMTPGYKFTKTWRLKNTGTCTWLMDYEIYFESGDPLEGPSAVKIARNVLPGESVDVSIVLTAPGVPGLYRSNYKMRNSNGEIFGSSEDHKPFYVEIWVGNAGEANLRFDLLGYFCEAEWSVDGRPIPCQGKDRDPMGFVRAVDFPRLEDGSKENEPVLLTVPAQNEGSVIRGRYPEIKILRGDRLRTVLGCEHRNDGCHVTFQLDYQVGDEGPVQNFTRWDNVFDSKLTVVDLSLEELSGQTVHLILTVIAHNDSDQNRAQWLKPRLVYILPAPATPTATSTP